MPPNSAVPPTYVPAEALPETLGINASLRPSVSWQAVFAGAVIAIAIELLLAVLGLAVGLTVANPGPAGGSGDVSGLGLSAGIWWVVSSIISLLIGGYAGARLANVPTRFDGLLQGLVIWGVVVLVAVWVLSAATTGVVSSAATALGGTISSVSRGVAATAPEIASAFGTSRGQVQSPVAGQEEQNAMREDVTSLLQAPNQPPQQMSHEQAMSAITQAAPELLAGGDKAQAAKGRIASIVAAQLNISQQDAEKRVDDFQQKLVQAKAKAAQTAQRVASEATGVASDAAFAIFVFLIVTGAAGAIGGVLARPRRLLRADADRWPR